VPENTIATRLGSWVDTLDYRSIPEDAIASAKLLILDQLGLQVAGATLPHVQPELRLVEQLQAHPEATVAHSGHRTAAGYAAFANGTLAGAGEFDDVHMFAAHIGSHVVPPALAFAETTGASGQDVITAVVAGAQVMSDLGRHCVAAMVGRGWHGSKILGTFGAAATTGKLLGLDPTQLAHALAIAGSDAGGGMEYEFGGGEVKRMHSGSAARLGAQAAQLARSGLTGPLTIFEGKRGIFRLFADRPAPDETTDIGNHFHIIDTIFRMYPTIGSAATVLEGLDSILRTTHLEWDDVAEVRIGLPEIALGHGAANTHPTDAVSAQFSTAFGVGVLLVLGHANLTDYLNPELWRDDRIRHVIDRVVPYAANFGPDTPLLSARIDVVLTDGRVHHHLQSGFRGHPGNPGRAEAVAEKFTTLTAEILGAPDSDELKRIVEHLDDEPNVLELVSHLVSKR
jgi:2-methylcitrate dehydratase PrpD